MIYTAEPVLKDHLIWPKYAVSQLKTGGLWWQMIDLVTVKCSTLWGLSRQMFILGDIIGDPQS